MFEKPVLTGKTEKENLEILETWANNLVDKLNYSITHIDDTNLVSGEKYMTEEKYQEISQNQYKELRELIVERTKGV